MLPQTIGSFTIDGLLHKSPGCTTYRGHQTGVGRKVVVRVYSGRPDKLESGRWLVPELRVLARILNANGVVPVADYGEIDGDIFVVRRFLPGGSLRERLRSGPMEPGEAGRLLKAIATILNDAHAKYVPHSNLTPENVLFDAEEQLYLADFYLARAANLWLQGQVSPAQLELADMRFTAFLMSPEGARGHGVKVESDIYSLGAMAYEMLTGRPLFTADTKIALVMKILSETPPAVSTLNPQLPETVDDVLNKALAREQEDRFETAIAFSTALSQALG
jgi:serine/threonine-protein kinase